MFVTAAGGYACPSSLPGEAAVHRIAAHLPKRPLPKKSLKSSLITLGTMIAAFKTAEFITQGHHNFGGGQPDVYVDPQTPADGIYNTASFLDQRRRFGA